MKIAIIHDYLHQFGGAERVVAVLHELFPDAPVYTSIYDRQNMPDAFKHMDIRTSFMQNLPFIFDNFRAYFLLYPFAFQSFDINEYDLIISSSSAFAKGIRKRKRGQVHVCYCHNPMRFVWQYEEYMRKENIPGLIKNFLPLALLPLKHLDLSSSKNVDYFIANSQNVSLRIKQIYDRDSTIVYPPVDVEQFNVSEKEGDYFLVVSRLASYKRIDIAVEAFSRSKLHLKVAGEGPALKALREKASPNIEFLGKVSDEEIRTLYSQCRALILPGAEDFGMTPLEAAASGRPAIAYAKGGALETIIDKKTGILFREQTAESLVNAVREFDRITFDKTKLREHAGKFSKSVFKERMMRFLRENKIL